MFQPQEPETVSKVTLHNFIADNIEIFSLPDIVVKMNALLENPNTNIATIADLISLDAGLTVQLLKLVNSSYYSLPKPVDSITTAISIIGVNDLRDMVMAAKIIKKFNSIPVDLITPESFWQHNIACATTCKVIAKVFKISNSERFFILGLLHDIGKLVMYIGQPELSNYILSLIKKNDKNIAEIEHIAFGFSHEEVGAELMKTWGLPESIYTPCMYHHNPEQAPNFKFETATLHLANSIANLIEDPFSFDDALPMKPVIWELLNVDSSTLIPLTHSAEEHYHDIAPLLMENHAS